MGGKGGEFDGGEVGNGRKERREWEEGKAGI